MRLWIWNYWQQPWNSSSDICVLQNDSAPNKQECLTQRELQRKLPQVLQAFVSLGCREVVYLNILLGFNDANQKL